MIKASELRFCYSCRSPCILRNRHHSFQLLYSEQNWFNTCSAKKLLGSLKGNHWCSAGATEDSFDAYKAPHKHITWSVDCSSCPWNESGSTNYFSLLIYEAVLLESPLWSRPNHLKTITKVWLVQALVLTVRMNLEMRHVVCICVGSFRDYGLWTRKRIDYFLLLYNSKF